MKHVPSVSGRWEPSLRRPLTALTFLAACFLSCLSLSAWADDASEVARLIRAGQPQPAMGLINKALLAKPRDPQMRFFKGVIQSEGGQTQEAIATFQALTVDFPELPEPHNNLAVLYADQGQLEKARVSLEMAVRTNPNYAIAYENLAEIHIKLALQHLERVLQLEPANNPAKIRLLRLQRALPGSGSAPAPASPVSPATPAASAASAPRQP